MDEHTGQGFVPDAGDHTRGRMGIDRDHLDSPNQAGPENRDPFGSIFGPEQEAVAFLQSCGIEVSDKTADALVELRVGPYPGPIAVPEAKGFPITEIRYVGEQFEQCLHRQPGGQLWFAPRAWLGTRTDPDV